MDIKAMAKSKRSHTRHHQPHKPKPKPQPQPPSSSSDPKPLKRNHGRDPHSGPPPSLPSNWSRYESDEEEEEEEQQRVVVGSAKAAPDVVNPKSEGADFGHLIAQAMESHSHYIPPSFDQSFPDLYQGLGPMLAVRGESILPWDGGDDFLGEDEGTTQEAPFFNLDLQALAEQLEKVDLAKRLFIEEDLLPPELRAPETKEADECTESFRKLENQKSAPSINTFHELFSLYLEAEKEAEMENQVKTSDVISSAFLSSSDPEPASVVDVTDHNLDNLTFLDDKEIPVVGSIPRENTPASSRFEVATAEAELDMLLDSFNETKFFDSPAPKSEEISSTKQHTDSSSTSKGNSATDLAPSKLSLYPSTSAFPNGLDDALDDLLEETSKGSYKYGVFRSDQVQVQVSGFDNALDDLLEETSKSKSKELEDFDTWFDNL